MMGDSNVLLFELGVVMLVAFAGAFLASKLKQSVIIGYIVVGMLLGPSIHFSLWGFEYNGLVRDSEFIQILSEIGLILLLFYVGLEFSFSRLTRNKAPTFLFAFVNISTNLLIGFVVGMLFGWPLFDTFFLAGVLGMNSTAIAAKSLLDNGRMNKPETELILAFEVVGTFVAMFLLMIGSGLMTSGMRDPGSIWEMLLGMAGFLTFFTLIAVFVVPKAIPLFERIKSDELFVLFALGILFACAALASACFVPAIIGAFFVGMVFAESKLADRLEKKLLSFKDAFVAVFFFAFGMMIDPANIPLVIPLLLVAVPLVLLNDIVFGTALAYFIGYSPESSVSVGTTIAGRAEESVMYASVGSSSRIATKAHQLVPFTGVFCFIMSAVTPLLMRRSEWLSRVLFKLLPESILWSARATQRLVKTMLMPTTLPIAREERHVIWLFALYTLMSLAVMFTPGWWHAIPLLLIPAFAYLFLRVMARYVGESIRAVNLDSLGMRMGGQRLLGDFITQFIASFFVLFLLMFAVLRYSWIPLPLLASVWLSAEVAGMVWLYRRIGPQTAIRLDAEPEAAPSPSAFGSVRSSWHPSGASRDTAHADTGAGGAVRASAVQRPAWNGSGPKPFEGVVEPDDPNAVRYRAEKRHRAGAAPPAPPADSVPPRPLAAGAVAAHGSCTVTDDAIQTVPESGRFD